MMGRLVRVRVRVARVRVRPGLCEFARLDSLSVLTESALARSRVVAYCELRGVSQGRKGRGGRAQDGPPHVSMGQNRKARLKVRREIQQEKRDQNKSKGLNARGVSTNGKVVAIGQCVAAVDAPNLGSEALGQRLAGLYLDSTCLNVVLTSSDTMPTPK